MTGTNEKPQAESGFQHQLDQAMRTISTVADNLAKYADRQNESERRLASVETHIGHLAEAIEGGFRRQAEANASTDEAISRLAARTQPQPLPVWNILTFTGLVISIQAALLVSYVSLSNAPIHQEVTQHHDDLHEINNLLAARGAIIGEADAKLEGMIKHQEYGVRRMDGIDAGLSENRERTSYLEGRLQQVEQWIGQIDTRGPRVGE